MKNPAAPVAVCSTCGRPLNWKGDCRACLVVIGFQEPAGEEADASNSLGYGDFEVVRRADGSFWELGHGAMGVTYRAADKVLNRAVALKVVRMPATTGDSKAVRERFLREARAAAALKHPNVASVFQFGATPEADSCYYAMELVEGETLEVHVRRDGPLKVEQALEIAIQVARALVAAAAHGLIHCDLKPSNIMLTGFKEDEPIAKVIDFGLAKSTAEATGERELTRGGFFGTPAFASPEQLAGQPTDARSDIYSLGVTLWYALTGEVPHAGKTIDEIRSSHTKVGLPLEQLVARKVPARVVKLLRYTLASDPAKRPQSARVLLADLERCRRTTARRQLLRRVALVLAFLVLFAAGLISYLWQRHDAAATPAPEKSIAVLPFENLSNDEANAFFVAGIQDEILTRLSKIADLKIISRTSTQHYKSTPENLPEIARQLGVAHILEGSVQRNGETVRVNVQLIKAANDSHVWADTYDRKLTNIFSVETEVAKAIADQLRAKLSGREEQVIAAKPTDNPEAYEAYLRGLAYSLKTANTPANALGAQKYLREAVRLDPKFALSWALLSDVDARGYRTLNLQPTVALREEARQAAETALTLQPNLGEALMANGFYRYACRKITTRRCITLNRRVNYCRIAAGFSSRWPMSREGEGSGTKANGPSTRRNGSTRATSACSPSTLCYIKTVADSQKRCGSLIRFSILRRTTSILSRKRPLLRRPKVTLRGLPRSSLRCIRMPTTRTLWKQTLPSHPGAPPCRNNRPAKGNIGQA